MIDLKIKKTKYLISAVATLLIVLVVLLVSLLSKSTIEITASPPESIIKINNAPLNVDSNGHAVAKVKPGTNTILVEAEGYISSSQIVESKAGRSANYSFQLKNNPTPLSSEDGQSLSGNAQFITEADEANAVFYLGDNGSVLYKAAVGVDENNKIKLIYNRPISNPPLNGIKDIIWSPKKDSAIFIKNDGVYFFDFKKYNFISQEEIKYGENIGSIAWSPDDSKIAYYYAPPGGEESLIFANKTNTEITRVANLAEMGIKNPFLAWSPNSEWLIIIPRNSDISSNKIYLFNSYTRTFKTVNEDGGNIEASFNRDNSKIFYTTYSIDPSTPVKAALNEMDADGKDKRSLELRAFISKIIFPNKNSSDILVATYNASKSVDSIFPFNLQSKSQTDFKINLKSKQFVTDIAISNDDKYLFYLADNQIYVFLLQQ